MGKNFIKVRDDNEPMVFEKSDEDNTFKLTDKPSAEWCPDGIFHVSDLRNRVEPWLSSLFQSEHLSLLIGSGLTTAIQYTACDSANNGMGEVNLTSKYATQINAKAAESAINAGRGAKPNIEDKIRVMCELLRGLEIMGNTNDVDELRSELNTIIDDFTNNISSIEHQIAAADDDMRTEAFNKLTMFLMSFASRTGTRDRLSIFTTNYDRLIEAGADVAGIHLIDRFVGSLSPIFRSSRLDIDVHYNPPGIRGEPRYLEGVVKYTKLHGSIDWINTNNIIRKIGLPFGAKDIKPFLNAPGFPATSSKIMIYPNASKDRETSEYPYVELFRDFAASICRPNSTLVTYGYSFGDEHINRVIRDMLTIPSTHLVIMAFDDSMGRIMQYYKDWGKENQISLIIGSDIANIGALTNYYLPKPAIDRATIRMSEILKKRYDCPQDEKVDNLPKSNIKEDKGDGEDDITAFKC